MYINIAKCFDYICIYYKYNIIHVHYYKVPHGSYIVYANNSISLYARLKWAYIFT